MASPSEPDAPRSRLSTILQTTILTVLWLTQPAKTTPQGGPTPLLSLPNEILLEIAGHLENAKDLNSLLRANKQLASLLKPVLRKRKPTPNHFGMNTLQWAAWQGDAELVKEEISKGSKINDRAKYRGWTALHFAAQDQPDIYQLLLENGADSDAKDTLGFTPIHYTTPRPPRSKKFY